MSDQDGSKLDQPISYQTPRLAAETICATLEADAGSKVLLADLLTSCALNPQEGVFVRLLMDPRRAKLSTARLAARAGLSIGDVMRLVSNAKSARAMLRAQDKITERVTELAADVMARALPHEDECENCRGQGTIGVLYRGGVKRGECPECHGMRRKNVIPSPTRQELAMKMSGLLKQPGSHSTQVNVGMQTNVGLRGFQSGPLTNNPEFRAGIDRLLYPKKYDMPKELGTPVDAELVKE